MYTPNQPNSLREALYRHRNQRLQSNSGSGTVRILMHHFAPVPANTPWWLVIHSCAVEDETLLEDFSETEPLFRLYECDIIGLESTYAQFAIHCGNVGSLRFLLDEGLYESLFVDGGRRMESMIHALSYNRTECYRELYKRFGNDTKAGHFEHLAWADDTEDIMADFIKSRRSFLFEPLGAPDKLLPSIADKALWGAIQRLRSGNVQYLLNEGVHLSWVQKQSEDPFQVDWPYFNQNQAAFVHTQAVLDRFDLPRLKVVV